MKKYKKIYSTSTIKNKDIKRVIENRYTKLIVLTFIIMAILALNLFKVQIIDNNYYLNKAEKINQSLVKSQSTPRGRIYDRNGKLIVDNAPVKIIYYQKLNNPTQKEEIDLAYKVADLIELDYSKISDKNLKKFWIIKNKEEASKKISLQEWQQLEERKISNADIEELKIARINNDELSTLTNKDRLAAYIYYLMNVGYSYDEKIIKKKDVTDKEYALIAENVNNLKGFNIRLDWERVYPYGDTFKSILGSVSTSEVGIPYELKDYYLSLGYNLNDRVGISYLEYQYESILKGNKIISKITSSGPVIIDEGSRGNDIVLTIDIELQKEIEKILTEEVLRGKTDSNTKYYDHSFVIISDPNNFEILAMAGKKVYLENNQYVVYDYTPGIITTSVTAGSIVKGASHTVGYMTGALSIGEVRDDSCIKIAATPLKCSWKKLGNINDVEALRYSSNVYQFKTAMKVGKANYIYDKPLVIDTSAFDTYRKTFNEYGLGVITGIDLPNENLGYNGVSRLPGHLLDFAIGQYDTYTPIQLMQYINTIATGGYRLKPHLLKAVYTPTEVPLTEILFSVKPEILNKVNILPIYMDRIKEGFRSVMTSGGTGAAYINQVYKAAGKTGTSESFLDTDGDGIIDKSTFSNTFGAYAPYDNPRVSFMVISPDIYYKETPSTTRAPINRRISSRISQKYFEIYK